MKNVVIVSYARTAVGAYLGGLKTVPVQDLATIAVREAVSRAKIDPQIVEEVILGHVISSADAGNIARRVALQSGMSLDSTGFTVNRICGSGFQALLCAAQEIQTGMADVVVAGGAESLSRVPYYLPLEVRYQGFKNFNRTLLCSNEEYAKHTAPEQLFPIQTMGHTAENIANQYGISREEQDQFAFWSQEKTKNAVKTGIFGQEIVPVSVKTKKSETVIDTDEHPRPDTTLEKLAALKPAFIENGTVTSGNSSGMNDGAAALVVMSEEKCLKLGLTPLAYVGPAAVGGVDPTIMGMGPAVAIPRLLKKCNLSWDDLDILEINEAFAAQCLGVMKELDHYIGSDVYNKLNPNGGAVALGHPLGMSGARISGSTALELNRRGAKYAIVSACIGGGQGIAILLENKNI
jgi:acetyl-CoA C-acetyltransferase